MEYRKITAIVRREAIIKLARNLKEIGVRGMTITRAEGFGHHAEHYSVGTMAPCAKIDIFTHKDMAKEITQVIMAIAYTGRSGDGIVAIYPIEELYRIQTRAALS